VLGKGGAWRLNPSYLPLPVLRQLSSSAESGEWKLLLTSSERILRESARQGFAPDWVVWNGRAFRADPVKGGWGSYDAIRVYLWNAMLPEGDPVRAAVGESTWGLLRHFQQRGYVPERVDLQKGKGSSRAGPPGFVAALLPEALRTDPASARKLSRLLELKRTDGLYGSPPAYYDQNLILFAQGFVERRYRFGEEGELVVNGGAACVGR
jgi:endoglucanase